MPDISMCKDEDCPSRLKCFRFTATPNEHRQYYMNFNNVRNGQDKCEYFIENKEYEITI